MKEKSQQAEHVDNKLIIMTCDGRIIIILNCNL